jgi:dipeptidyl aminopeptidase/acylaminoacyl peptidase
MQDLVVKYSPLANAPKLRCPLFLFHADDDTNVPSSDNEQFDVSVKRSNHNVTFVRVPTGNHYDSMIQQGIPKAIAWFKSLPAVPPAAK